MGSEGTVIEDRNDVFANQRPEGQWDIIDPAIADRIGEDVKVSGFFPADERLGDALAALRERLRRLGETAGELPLGKLEIVMNDFEALRSAPEPTRPPACAWRWSRSTSAPA